MPNWNKLNRQLLVINIWHNSIYLISVFSFSILLCSGYGIVSDQYASLAFVFFLPSLIFFMNTIYMLFTTARVVFTSFCFFIFLFYNLVALISGYEPHDLHFAINMYFVLCWACLFAISVGINILVTDAKDDIECFADLLLRAFKSQPLLFNDREQGMIQFISSQPFSASYRDRRTYSFTQEIPLADYYKHIRYFTRIHSSLKI